MFYWISVDFAIAIGSTYNRVCNLCRLQKILPSQLSWIHLLKLILRAMSNVSDKAYYFEMLKWCSSDVKVFSEIRHKQRAGTRFFQSYFLQMQKQFRTDTYYQWMFIVRSCDRSKMLPGENILELCFSYRAKFDWWSIEHTNRDSTALYLTKMCHVLKLIFLCSAFMINAL